MSFLQWICTVSQEIEKKQGLQCSESFWCLVPCFLCWSGQGDMKPSANNQEFTQPQRARRRSNYIMTVFFLLRLTGMKSGSSLNPCTFFRVLYLDRLCYWEWATDVFWDERCCVSAICCFFFPWICFLSTDICTGVINRLNCPNRDSSLLLLQNPDCVPVATAYTAKLQLVQPVFH